MPKTCQSVPDSRRDLLRIRLADRRAERIARERGWPLPIARSEAEAEAELTRGRASGHSAPVFELRPLGGLGFALKPVARTGAG